MAMTIAETLLKLEQSRTDVGKSRMRLVDFRRASTNTHAHAAIDRISNDMLITMGRITEHHKLLTHLFREED